MLLFVINFIVFFATCQKETAYMPTSVHLEIDQTIVGH